MIGPPHEAPSGIVSSGQLLAKPISETAARDRDQGVDVERRGARAQDGPHAGREGRLHGAAQLHEVPRRQQVQGAAQGGPTHDLPRRDQAQEILATEPRDARPQPDERRPRDLRLQRDQPLDRVARRGLLAREEHLPRQRRAIELTCRHIFQSLSP